MTTTSSSNRRGPLAITVPGIFGTLGVFFVAAVCVRLGFWQLDRLAQRDALNVRMTERLAEPAVPLERGAADTAGLSYHRVHVRGELDHDRSIVLAGRSLRGAPGIHLLTPLLLPDGGAVLINRGWVPSPDGASADLDALAPTSTIDADAIVIPFTPVTLPPRDSGGPAFQRVWFRIDLAALRKQFPYPIASFQARLLPEPADDATRPTRIPLPEMDRGPHLGYAIQWFSFAAIFLIGWAAMVLRRSRR